MRAEGNFTYWSAIALDGEIRFDYQAKTFFYKSIFDFVVSWETRVEVYDSSGRLLGSQTHYHNTNPVGTSDVAYDDHYMTVARSGTVYTLRLYSAGAAGAIDTKTITVGQSKSAPPPIPTPKPEPEPPEPVPQPIIPVIPEPTPVPPPTPPPGPIPGLPELNWTWLAIGAVVILALTMTDKKGRRQ